MRRLLVVAGFLVSAPLLAQTGSWSRVEELPAGTQVMVTTRHAAPCIVGDVSDAGMECYLRGQSYWVDRARVVEVRMTARPGWGAGVPVGTAVGAVAGGVLGANANNGDAAGKPARALAGAALGGFVGFLVGHVFVPAHGALVYRRF